MPRKLSKNLSKSNRRVRKTLKRNVRKTLKRNVRKTFKKKRQSNKSLKNYRRMRGGVTEKQESMTKAAAAAAVRHQNWPSWLIPKPSTRQILVAHAKTYDKKRKQKKEQKHHETVKTARKNRKQKWLKTQDQDHMLSHQWHYPEAAHTNFDKAVKETKSPAYNPSYLDWHGQSTEDDEFSSENHSGDPLISTFYD